MQEKILDEIRESGICRWGGVTRSLDEISLLQDTVSP